MSKLKNWYVSCCDRIRHEVDESWVYGLPNWAVFAMEVVIDGLALGFIGYNVFKTIEKLMQ